MKDTLYKYLKILEANDILHTNIKSRDIAEYLRRNRKILKCQLHGRLCIQATNTSAVPVMRYGSGIFRWTAEYLRGLDSKNRKLIRLHGAHYPQEDVDRPYVEH